MTILPSLECSGTPLAAASPSPCYRQTNKSFLRSKINGHFYEFIYIYIYFYILFPNIGRFFFLQNLILPWIVKWIIVERYFEVSVVGQINDPPLSLPLSTPSPNLPHYKDGKTDRHRHSRNSSQRSIPEHRHLSKTCSFSFFFPSQELQTSLSGLIAFCFKGFPSLRHVKMEG